MPTDTPSLEFEKSSYIVSENGGELVIPVTSTGIDDVRVSYSYSDRWDTDQQGNLTPKVGWIKIKQVIWELTRELPVFDSGVVIEIEPNTSNYERKASVIVRSFTISKSVEIIQPGASK
jgi:hypothetical protein